MWIYTLIYLLTLRSLINVASQINVALYNFVKMIILNLLNKHNLPNYGVKKIQKKIVSLLYMKVFFEPV